MYIYIYTFNNDRAVYIARSLLSLLLLAQRGLLLVVRLGGFSLGVGVGKAGSQSLLALLRLPLLLTEPIGITTEGAGYACMDGCYYAWMIVCMDGSIYESYTWV